jgi:hypothetical protein
MVNILRAVALIAVVSMTGAACTAPRGRWRRRSSGRRSTCRRCRRGWWSRCRCRCPGRSPSATCRRCRRPGRTPEARGDDRQARPEDGAAAVDPPCRPAAPPPPLRTPGTPDAGRPRGALARSAAAPGHPRQYRLPAAQPSGRRCTRTPAAHHQSEEAIKASNFEFAATSPKRPSGWRRNCRGGFGRTNRAAIENRSAGKTPRHSGQFVNIWRFDQKRDTISGVSGLDRRRSVRRGRVGLRSAVIGNEKGEVVFEQRDVEIPKFWSQQATNIVVSKYFRGRSGTPERERASSS